MSRRQVLEAISGILLGMFVAVISQTVVSTSLPIIVPELGGDQTAYTWVVTATLLTTAISTPVWGKLADLTSRKVLILTALVLFVLASAGAGLSQHVGVLIAFRALQGIGGGGLMALSQILMADIISPRERGKYMGLFGAIMSVSTVAGPLLGGLVTDSIGWRWNFYIAIPIAAAAFVVLSKTVHVEQIARRKARIDYLGIVLLAGATSLLLIWVTNVADYGWISLETLLMVGGAVIAAALFILVELRSREPLVPLTMFRNRTFTLAVMASIAIGVAMFGTAVYLSQYMQMARGASPAEAGLMTIPMALGTLLSATIIGQLVTRFGKWKRYLVLGSILMIAGTSVLGTLRYDSPYWYVGIGMFLLGSGVGMTMQNMVLVVQNTADPRQMGAASSGVNFFRTVGGTTGVSVMGAVLAASMQDLMTSRQDDLRAAIASLGAEGAPVAEMLQSGTLPVVRELPESVRVIVEDIAAQSVSHAFLIGVPLAVVSLITICFLPNRPLTRQTTIDRLRSRESEREDPAVALAAAETGSVPVIRDVATGERAELHGHPDRPESRAHAEQARAHPPRREDAAREPESGRRRPAPEV